MRVNKLQFDTAAFFLWGAVLVIAVAGLLPMISMVAQSLFAEGKPTFSAFESLFHSLRHWSLLLNSLGLAFAVSATTVAVGVPIGLFFGKSDLPGTRPMCLLYLVPLLVPPYIMAVAWSNLLMPHGLLSHFLSRSTLDLMHGFLFGFGGTLLVLSTVYLPIPMLLTIAFLNSIDPRLEEAARIVAPWPKVLAEITIPLIFPGILFSFLLVFVLALGEFSVPSYLRFEVFSVVSFTHFSALYDFKAATVFALPLALVTLLLLVIEGKFLHEETYAIAPFSTGKRCNIRLGSYKIPLFAAVFSPAAFLVILPMAGLLESVQEIHFFSTAIEKAGDALLRTFLYAFIGASVLTVVGFFVGYLVKNHAVFCWQSVDKTCLFLFAMPGTVLGIGLIGLWNRPATAFVYATFLIILLGYVAKYCALPSRIIVAQLLQVPDSMEEAAMVAGAGWLRRILYVVMPLSLPGIAAAWLVSFLFCMRDIDITMLLYPPGCETLPVRIFTLMANGAPPLIAALCVLMMLAVVLPASLLLAVWPKGEKGVFI